LTAVLTSRIPTIIAEAEARTALVVEKTVFDIEGGCKARSRVDKGQMREGWTGEMTGAAEGIVYNPVEHSIFNELGTTNMPAQPMLTPSVEEAGGSFVAAMGEVYG
jgi:hypothetical protein